MTVNIDTGALHNRLKKNLKHLGKWLKREGIDCFRVYDADIPEFNFAIDIYRAIDIYGAMDIHDASDTDRRGGNNHEDSREKPLWIHVQEYQAPRHIDAAKSAARLQQSLAVIAAVFHCPPERLFVKTRKKQKGKNQYERLQQSGEFHRVREFDCLFWVNFRDYLDTGLFLDHRFTRKTIGKKAAGKHFLNLFAYTGAATVHAAKGGALSTTTVDMSQTYLQWAQRNMALNALNAEHHRFIHADCLQWLQQPCGRKYDLIFMDPPSFSTSKRMHKTLDIQRDHRFMIQQAMKLLASDGCLLFSNNLRSFKLDQSLMTAYAVTDISRRTLPLDFERNPGIRRIWTIKHKP